MTGQFVRAGRKSLPLLALLTGTKMAL